MKAKERKNYVETWNRHIDEMGLLAMNPNNELSRKVIYHMDELKELVPKIADAKIKASEKVKKVTA